MTGSASPIAAASVRTTAWSRAAAIASSRADQCLRKLRARLPLQEARGDGVRELLRVGALVAKHRLELRVAIVFVDVLDHALDVVQALRLELLVELLGPGVGHQGVEEVRVPLGGVPGSSDSPLVDHDLLFSPGRAA